MLGCREFRAPSVSFVKLFDGLLRNLRSIYRFMLLEKFCKETHWDFIPFGREASKSYKIITLWIDQEF